MPVNVHVYSLKGSDLIVNTCMLMQAKQTGNMDIIYIFIVYKVNDFTEGIYYSCV